MAVPSGATTGNVVVTVSSISSNGIKFTGTSGYANRRSITIDHTKVPNTDQTNFPVLISGTYSYLATTSNGGNVTNSNGYDIIFTSDAAGLNVLPFEQESYNASTGAVNYWVQVPTLSHTLDTVVYMFYGNSAVTTDQSNKNGTWDSNFKAVWHLPNGSSLSGTDSSSNAVNGTNSGLTATAGLMDGAASGDGGSGHQINTAANPYTSSTFSSNGLTLSAWVKPVSNSGTSHIVSLEGAYVIDVNAGKAGFEINGSGTDLVSSTSVPTGSWTHIVGTSDSSGNMKLYVNGALDSSSSQSFYNLDSLMRGYSIGGHPTASGYNFNGIMDEVKISNVARSADWIATEYNNQNNPSTFYSMSSQAYVVSPAISSISPSSGSVGTTATIAGFSFGSTQGSSTVTFNGTTATPTSWSATSISVPVPTGATSGNVIVTVSGAASNSVWFTVPGSSSTNIYGYTNWRRITIDHTKVPNTDQVNFPVLVSGTYSYLATTANGGSVTSANGYDIIFTSDEAGANILPFEQESYNPSTGAVNYWVQIPMVRHTTDTMFYMFYGNSAVKTDLSNKTGVWDSNYVGVWHLPNGSSLSPNESTTNENNGTNNAASATTGQIDGAASFNGSTNITLGNTDSLNITGNLTIEAWVKTNATGDVRIVSHSNSSSPNNGYEFGLGNQSAGKTDFWNGTAWKSANTAVNDNNWHLIAVSVNGSTENFYKDGVSDGSVSGGVPNSFSGTGTLGLSFNGTIDEIRLSGSARSADWLATEYNNQNSPATFYSVATNPPTITSLSPMTGAVGTTVTITGLLFGSTQGGSTVTFNGTTATPTSWSATSISVPVPTGATSGNVIVTVSGVTSNAVWFTLPGTWSNHYSYQRTITIDHTKVPNTDQTNFPVLISGTYSYLATTSNGGNVTNSNGYDIIFTSDAAGLNVLPFEQESYNASTGAVNYWVQVPTLSHTLDTVVYMFYGNSAVTTDQSNKNGTWDSNFKAVWHLPNGSSLSGTDSSSNAVNGTNSGLTATAGLMDGAASGDGGSGHQINTAANPYTSSTFSSNGLTLSAWVKPVSNSGTSHIVSLEGAYVIDVNAGKAGFEINGSGTDLVSSTSVPTGSWTHIVGTSDSSGNMKLYVNGALDSSSSQSFYNLDSLMRGYSIGGHPTASGYNLNGIMDEVKISNVARSADWIATEYNNQNSPSTFYNTSPADPVSISSVSPSSGTVGTTITIAGLFFGSTQGGSTVTFNGTTATPTSWSATSISVPVPTGATSGNVIVTVSGAASNSVWFTVPGSSSIGYRFRRSITVDHTKVPNTDRTNFPVFISGTYSYLATTSNGGNVTNSNGYDIIFTSDAAGSNVLPFERESYNASTGAVIYWVQAPTLSHTTDTIIYMFYGNSAVTTDQSNKNGTWDSNFKAVWHLPNGTSLSGADSSSNAVNGTNSGLTATAGLMDGAASGDGGSGHQINTANNPYTSSTFSSNGLTLSAWVKPVSNSGTSHIVSLEGAYVIDVNAGKAGFEINGSGTDLVSSASVPTGSWTHIVGASDSSGNLKLYVNGVLSSSSSQSFYNLDSLMRAYSLGGHPTLSGYNFNGGLDEARVSNTARSADWIATEYNNQNSPSTFYSVASQVDMGGPVITSVSPATGGSGTSVTVTGAGFGASQGTSTAKFNGTAASPTSWSSTSIAVPVPSGATTGSVVVTVSGIPSNPATFTVTGNLSGTVTRQSDGTAISGATVQVLQNRAVIATATTASNGTYSVSSLGTGEYDVSFSASGFGSVLQSAVTVPANGATLNQVLGSAGTISGKVTQSNGVTAISGATVSVLQSSETVGSATTDSNGNYSVSNLGAGSYEVEVSASGYVNQGLSGVSVTSGNTTTENFSLNAVGTQPISYVYDQLGRLTAAIDQAGNVAGYAYDAVGNILSISRGTAQQLSVITFSPNTGSVASTVTIYGTAFSTTPSQNTVKFNGTTATVTSASVTSLVVSVPSGATTGTISVTTLAGTATSSASFTVTTAGAGQPTISSFTPSIGTSGTSVSISGTNYDTTLANDRVKFNVGPALPSTVTSTTISTSVPSKATSGHLVVTTPSGTVFSSGDFFVPPSGFGVSSVGYSGRVSVGGNLTVTISSANTIGLVIFDGTAGHRLSLLTSSNTMTSTGGATTISINNPDGSSLMSQSVTTSAPFISPQKLSTTGTYTIVVQPSGGATGSITLALYDVSLDITGSINVDGTGLTVSITSPGQIGTLLFTGTAAHLLTVHATSNSIGNVTLTLKDPNGGTVTTQNSSSSSFNLSTVALPVTGTYSISVLPNQANTGSITISVTTP